jgi:hypothetical protein
MAARDHYRLPETSKAAPGTSVSGTNQTLPGVDRSPFRVLGSAPLCSRAPRLQQRKKSPVETSRRPSSLKEVAGVYASCLGGRFPTFEILKTVVIR